ncbi:MAG: hypothetical protein FJ095_05920 [Deltaproteobacteria bacterium]|nr:hypothetical protein [Deltaproteobacteria bacterium]
MRTHVLKVALVLSSLAFAGCDNPSSPGLDSASASASASTAPAASAALDASGKRAFTVTPDIAVDERGIAVGPERIDLGEATGAGKLSEALERIPADGKQPAVRTTTKSNLRDVGAVLDGLGKRGFKTILLKMEGARTDLLGEYVVVPERHVDKPEDCSAVVSVLEDSSTAVWPVRGGGGKKARKGLSGPDLSVTGENVVDQLKGCSSKVAFFSANAKMRWEHAFHVGALLRKSDSKSIIEQLVFLAKEPVAGLPVKLEK